MTYRAYNIYYAISLIFFKDIPTKSLIYNSSIIELFNNSKTMH